MEGTPKAIEPKGIVRNATKIGVQDGQAEDLINLRFMDGSWRASGDGMLVHTMTGTQYTQLYVHTNVYHHLLGVCQDNGQSVLKWFAEIGTDGTTFYPLDGTTNRTRWPQDMQSLPTSPVALTTVVGDIWITQNGHLLTVIDENDDFEYIIFKTDEKAYVIANVDVNGQTSSRSLYPFGDIHFNLLIGSDSAHTHFASDSSQDFEFDSDGTINHTDATAAVPRQESESTTKEAAKIWHSQMLSAFTKATEANQFTAPFLIISALKLYDGSYMYACNPVYLNPREKKLYNAPQYAAMHNGIYTPGTDESFVVIRNYGTLSYVTPPSSEAPGGRSFQPSSDETNYPVFTSGLSAATIRDADFQKNTMTSVVRGSDIIVTINQSDLLKLDKSIFKSIAFFITPQSHPFDMSANGYKNGEVICVETHRFSGRVADCNISYRPPYREKSDMIYDLMHSPFYLLREYSLDEIRTLNNSFKIDLSGSQYTNRLKNITAQNRLPYEAISRETYLPKTAYMYNSRLHIANYKNSKFFGYPIDFFQLHNHAVRLRTGSWFNGVLSGCTADNDANRQYDKTNFNFPAFSSNLKYFVLVEVEIEASNGTQKVVRYIQPYSHSSTENGRADFVESLNQLICYPDVRAKIIRFAFCQSRTETYSGWRTIGYNKAFTLKPHPYLNMAYHIDEKLKPINIMSSTVGSNLPNEIPDLQNAEEYFPNGLKVSKPDNPMFFPVENTYQVGSAEILALMSNTLPVGTGQTGDAPLYIFCKDGVYAAFVDASGEMVYPNTRPLAPDVCNNPRSVTKTDLGVVFTTDRGLMRMNGNEVEEIGQPAEGDVVHFVDPTKVDYSKYATDALTKIARLPSSLCDTKDFLTYLQGAIINYNHNMRELIVTNPTKSYSYVLDRDGNWSRRTYTAKQYVSNYPTSYRLTDDGYFFKMDEEGDVNTSLEHRKEADNSIFYLSNVIKLDSIGFKQAYRFVIRGYFESQTGQNVGIVVEGSYDGRKFSPLGYNRKSGKFTNIGCHVSHTDVRFYRVILCGQVTGKTRIDYMEMSADGSVLNTKIR